MYQDKRIYLLPSILLVAVCAMAQCRTDVLITVSQNDGDLAPAVGGTVRVCQPGATGSPCNPLEILYTNPSLTTVQPLNPFTSDSYGNYTFCAKDPIVYLETTYKGTVKVQPTYVISAGIQSINNNGNYSQSIVQGTGINVNSVNGVTTISATGGGGGGGGPSAPLLSFITLNPTTVAGGNTSAGTVTLTSAALSGGSTVTLSSSDTNAATVPSSVNVSANATTAQFNVTTRSVSANTTVVITGTLGLRQTANLTVTAPPPPAQPIYGGVGQPGANSTVTLNGTNVTLSTGDVIPQLQTTAEKVGESWQFSPNNQVIYLLLTGNSHTFTDQNNAPFPFNAPITVNLGGRTMYLYQSQFPLAAPFTVRVAS